MDKEAIAAHDYQSPPPEQARSESRRTTAEHHEVRLGASLRSPSGFDPLADACAWSPHTNRSAPRRSDPESVLSANIVLSRLANVRRSGPASWRADCPNGHHHARGSLAVTETADGYILMHCFACDDTYAILRAIGLEVSDLFPRRTQGPAPAARQPARETFRLTCWQAAIGVIDREASCVLAAATMIARGEPLHDQDYVRLQLAQQRIDAARAVLA